MIANPIDAIGNCSSRAQLAKILEELMKPWYPESDKDGWEVWSVKYSSIVAAKKCALSMYKRMMGI